MEAAAGEAIATRLLRTRTLDKRHLRAELKTECVIIVDALKQGQMLGFHLMNPSARTIDLAVQLSSFDQS
ncbi:MAG: hypothetical protein EA367_13800 [Leptolyngbya sp. DLM2.Bin15]|nr:MAG: hypothetical protein EA367_13800 [Leptolyngbya sp. DLM2.Bin15]